MAHDVLLIDDILSILELIRRQDSRADAAARRKLAIEHLSAAETASGRFTNMKSARETFNDKCTRHLGGHSRATFDDLVRAWLSGQPGALRSELLLLGGHDSRMRRIELVLGGASAVGLPPAATVREDKPDAEPPGSGPTDLPNRLQALADDVGADDEGSLPNPGDPYIPSGTDDRDKVFREIAARRGQSAFRRGLFARYGTTCMITRTEVAAVIEAAHIWPYRGPNDNHLANGLLLRSDLHTLFDLNLLGVEPEGLRVHLHPAVGGAYKDFAGRVLKLQGVHRPSAKALIARWAAFSP